MNYQLKVHLSAIMRDKGYTFITSLYDYQHQLKLRFKYEASLDKIEDALTELEQELLHEEQGIIEYPEDFELI